jgi:hypothetical protein
MSQVNNLGQYVGVHKSYDHVGNILPDIEHCEGERPSWEFKPAAWLPVQFYDKYFENWVVTTPGKVLALDPHNRVMPAQYGLAGATVTYTQNDVDAGVIDITTGLALTATKTVTLTDVDGSTSHFMGRTGSSFHGTEVKYPIGVCPYSFHQWAGDGSLNDDGFNPVYYREHNYNMQHQVTPLCDYVIKLPLIPGQVATESVDNNWTDAAIAPGGGGSWRTRANCTAYARYNATTGLYPVLSTYPVVGWALANNPVAANTPRTTISSTVSNMLVTEVASVDRIVGAGDWWMDYEVGILFVYSANGTTLPPVAPASTITYFHYATAPTVVSRFACVVCTTTELMPGDFLITDTNSNLVRAAPGSVNSLAVIGQVLAIDSSFPKDYLDRVRTAYDPALRTNSSGTMSNAVAGSASVGLGQMDQMSGSATDGIPTLITYAGGSNAMVIINLIHR